MKYDIVGKTFKNKKGLEFIVLCQFGKSKNSIALYTIQFVESGYIAYKVSSGHIRAGEVKDYLSPSVFSVGCLGYALFNHRRKDIKRVYQTWRNILRRCYDETYNKYKWYGGIGVTVCERWHRLDYFLEDIVHIPGYDKTKFENNELELDKDIINRNAKCYSLSTCCFVTHKENVIEANKRKKQKHIVQLQ